MNRLATASVFNGRELGDSWRVCVGGAVKEGSEFEGENPVTGVPSERRSLPMGF